MKKLSLEAYKGTRDFYPEDQFYQNYIFSVWRRVAESYGYLEYNASLLEDTDLYRAKSGEEIVSEQTYSFTDRGGRDVTIRPEMTPTVARMVAQKRKELSFPLRWFSMPNLFRYERPQRGRLREHWQLNCDMFGVEGVDADVEIISLAYDIMKGFGATDGQFEIRLNSRKFLNYLADDFLQISPEQKHKVFKLIDKMNKMPAAEFEKAGAGILKDKFEKLIKVIKTDNLSDLPAGLLSSAGAADILTITDSLKQKGVTNVKFDPSIMRGFDYYTGTVFEMYDANPENPRALFGGGRYDDLVGIFGVEKVSGIGFGWGDVTTRDFLETHGLLPEYKPAADLYICHLDGFIAEASGLAAELRAQKVNVAVDLTGRKVSQQVKTADRQKIPFVLVVGEEEVKSDSYKLKNLKNSLEETLKKGDLAAKILART